MIQLYLVRHGECEGSGKYIGRRSDFPLTEQGREQIRILATAFPAITGEGKIDFLYSSPMIRARESAFILSEELGIPIQELPGVEEVDFGEWEGFTYSELEESFPGDLLKWVSNSIELSPPCGESLEDLQLRVLAAFAPILEKVNDEKMWKIVLVSHRGPLAVLITNLLKLDLKYFWNFKIDRGSVTILSVYPQFCEISLLNRRF